jgi:hypothetical protein
VVPSAGDSLAPRRQTVSDSPYARLLLVDPARHPAWLNLHTTTTVLAALQAASTVARTRGVDALAFLGQLDKMTRAAGAQAPSDSYWASPHSAEIMTAILCAWIQTHAHTAMLEDLVREQSTSSLSPSPVASLRDLAQHVLSIIEESGSRLSPQDLALNTLAAAGVAALCGPLHSFAAAPGTAGRAATATEAEARHTWSTAPPPTLTLKVGGAMPTEAKIFQRRLKELQLGDAEEEEVLEPVLESKSESVQMPAEWVLLEDRIIIGHEERATLVAELRAAAEQAQAPDDEPEGAIERSASPAPDDEPEGAIELFASPASRMPLFFPQAAARLATPLGLEGPTGWKKRWSGISDDADLAPDSPHFQRLCVSLFADVKPPPPPFAVVCEALENTDVSLCAAIAALKSCPGVKSISKKTSDAAKSAKQVRDASYTQYALATRAEAGEPSRASAPPEEPSPSGAGDLIEAPSRAEDLFQSTCRLASADIDDALRRTAMQEVAISAWHLQCRSAEPTWEQALRAYRHGNVAAGWPCEDKDGDDWNVYLASIADSKDRGRALCDHLAPYGRANLVQGVVTTLHEELAVFQPQFWAEVERCQQESALHCSKLRDYAGKLDVLAAIPPSLPAFFDRKPGSDEPESAAAAAEHVKPSREPAPDTPAKRKRGEPTPDTPTTKRSRLLTSPSGAGPSSAGPPTSPSLQRQSTRGALGARHERDCTCFAAWQSSDDKVAVALIGSNDLEAAGRIERGRSAQAGKPPSDWHR